MSPVVLVITLIPLLVGVQCGTPPPDGVGLPKYAARQLVYGIRDVIEQARDGMFLEPLRENVLQLQKAALDLINQLDDDVSPCEVQTVIKMAASGTASHEVLTVMLAEDELSVLNGRLALSFGFLKHVVHQLEDELPRSTNITSYLTAIVFGTNATANIIQTADAKVKAAASSHSNGGLSRVRRQLNTNKFNLHLGHGWSLGSHGVQWKSQNGRFHVYAKPTFPGGLKHLGNIGVDVGIGGHSKSGRFQWHVNPSYNHNGNHGFGVHAGFTLHF